MTEEKAQWKPSYKGMPSFNPNGRPLMFGSVEELSEKLDAYFDMCDKGRKTLARNRKGEPILDKNGDLAYYQLPRPYSVEGLAVHLGCSDETLRKYAKREPFVGITSRAFTRIHQQWVENGLTGEFNPKMAALCLSANVKTYNIKQDVTVTALSLEDKLREAKKKRLEEHIPEAQITDSGGEDE